jgi:hypothetical protein
MYEQKFVNVYACIYMYNCISVIYKYVLYYNNTYLLYVYIYIYIHIYLYIHVCVYINKYFPVYIAIDWDNIAKSKPPMKPSAKDINTATQSEIGTAIYVYIYNCGYFIFIDICSYLYVYVYVHIHIYIYS